MTILQGRSWRLEIGKILIESITGANGTPGNRSLDFEFSISRDKTPNPNSAEFVIYNLNPAHRAELVQDDVPVRFSAGYRNSMDLLFYGELRHATFEGRGDIKTIISSGDSDSKIVESMVSKSFARGTLVKDVVESLLDSIGAKKANWEAFGSSYKTISGLQLPNGLALRGSSSKILTEMCQSMGFEWCIIDGEFQIRPVGESAGEGPLITPATGLEGSPQQEKRGKDKTKSIVSFKCRLMPKVLPGFQVRVEHRDTKQNILLTETRHYGATFSNDWSIDAKGEVQ